MPELIPRELGLPKRYREYIIQTTFKLISYGRRVIKRKGFSKDPEVVAKRLAFI